MLRLIIAVICLIIYGSLFPFSGWAYPAEPLFSFLNHWPATIERADVVQNVLAYIPLGLFIALQASRSGSRLEILWRAAITGFILSLVMECIQQFLPERVASLSDLAFNIAGSVIGAFAGLQLSNAIKEQSTLHNLHLKWLRPTEFTTLGLMCILVWVLSQTSPWVPTFDVSQLRRGAAALYHALHDPQSIVLTQAASYFFSFVALGLVWTTIALRRRHAFLIFAGFFSAVLLSKVMIAGRQLSLEAAVGFAAALLFLPAGFSLYIPGRFADITTVLLGLAGWIAGWFGILKQPVADVPVRSRRPRRTGVDRQAAQVMEDQLL